VNVGTKELKNRLSHYLRQVRAGQTIRVTDRGRAVAELRAVEPPATADHVYLRELEALGVVSVGTGRFEPIRPARLRGRVRASQAILADRG
jgi:antitoxin (DNA-binding transcriptional repressor) of toxin-antitoxin stability system